MTTLTSFRRRLLVAVFLFIVVLSSLFAVLRHQAVNRRWQSSLEELLPRMVRRGLRSLDFHRRLLRGMGQIGSESRFFDGIAPTLMPFLVVADGEGRVLERHRGPLGEGTLLPRDLLSSQLAVSPLLSRDGRSLVVLARPMGPEGWIVGGFSPEIFFDGEESFLEKGQWALLLSAEAEVLLAFGEAWPLPVGTTLPENILSAPSSRPVWLDERHSFFMLPLPGEGLYAALGYPESLAWREALAEGLRAGGTVALGSFLVLLLLFPSFASVLRDLTALSTSLARSEEILALAPNPVEAMECLGEFKVEGGKKARFAEMEAMKSAFGGLLRTVAREGEELASLYEEATSMELELSDSNQRLSETMERLSTLLDLSQRTQGAGDLDDAADVVTHELGRLYESPFAALVALHEGLPLLWSWLGRSELREDLLQDLKAAPPEGFFCRFSVVSHGGLRFFQFPIRTFQSLVGALVIALPYEGDEGRLRETMEPFLSHLAGLLHSRAMLVEVKEAYHDVSLRMQVFTQAYHEETGAHLGRIGRYAVLFGSELDLDREFLSDLRAFSQLHDVGKLKVPQAILSKPSSLTAGEFEVVKKHTLWGAEILGDSPWLSMARDICLSHHERWCGGGYPQGLSGEAIPLAARIVSLCDVYDALRSRRSYKPPLSHDRTLDILFRGDGRVEPDHFDPRLLEILARRSDDLAAIFEDLPDEAPQG